MATYTVFGMRHCLNDPIKLVKSSSTLPKRAILCKENKHEKMLYREKESSSKCSIKSALRGRRNGSFHLPPPCSFFFLSVALHWDQSVYFCWGARIYIWVGVCKYVHSTAEMLSGVVLGIRGGRVVSYTLWSNSSWCQRTPLDVFCVEMCVNGWNSWISCMSALFVCSHFFPYNIKSL